MARAGPPARLRYVDTLARSTLLFDVCLETLLGLLDFLDQPSFRRLDQLTKRSTFLGRDATDQLFRGCQRALLSEVTRPQLTQRTLFSNCCFKIERGERRWITSKAGKAFEVLLERFAGCFNLKLW